MDAVLHCSQHGENNAICTGLKRPRGQKVACQYIISPFIANFGQAAENTKRGGEKANLKLGFSTVSLLVTGLGNLVICSKPSMGPI